MYTIIEMTHEEKVEVYKKIDKKKLIEMLIEANKIISQIRPVVYSSPTSLVCPSCGKYKALLGDGVIHQLCECNL